MTLTTLQTLITISVIILGTIFTRFIPFVLFPPSKKTPQFIEYLGTVLPYCTISLLVVYCLKSVCITEMPFALPEVISILFIIFIHKLLHNTLLSIGGGTLIYMILVQYVFFS